jgi:hypothetical protein
MLGVLIECAFMKKLNCCVEQLIFNKLILSSMDIYDEIFRLKIQK